MKRYFRLTLTKSDADTMKAVYDEIMRLDLLADFEGSIDTRSAWVSHTSLTREQLMSIMWVVDAVQASKGTVGGRSFYVSFPNKMDSDPKHGYAIVAVQEWINRDTWERSWVRAGDWDLNMNFGRRRAEDPIGDMQYNLWLFGRNRHIARYKSLAAALDTLFDMGVIDKETRAEALRMHKDGSPGGDFK